MPWLAPRFGPGGLADDEGRHCNQLRTVLVQARVIIRVPAVAADQHTQAPGRGVDHIQRCVACRAHITLLIALGVQLTLRLTERQPIAAKRQAAVIQRATADLQLAIFNAGIGQHNRACHQCDAELSGQAAKQCLIVPRHRSGLDPQVGVIQTVPAFGPQDRRDKLQRIAPRQPFHGVIQRGGLIELILLATGEQPGADMFRQYHHRAWVDQPLVTGLLQISGELAVQSLGVLVISRKQLGLDPQQVAALTGLAFIDGQTNAQIGQVVTRRTLIGPDRVADEAGNAQQNQADGEEFAHKKIE